jgi:ATP-dependent RNA helicase MSS116, mitochondrial
LHTKIGTGKTLAFLLPSLERLLVADLSLYRNGQNIGILIVAPTRELAIQIADTATTLLMFHGENWNVMSAYGGTRIQRDIALFNKRLPTVLVATPGRLLDHLQETKIRGRKFSDILGETQLLVLDEADRLFEGFQKETKRILSYLPRPEKRQTLLFSATVPKRLKRSMSGIMPADYVEVDCVSDADITTQTNQRVEQLYAVLPSMDVYVSSLVSIVIKAMKDDLSHKIVVFLPTAKLVKFFSDLFNIGFEIPVMEMHSRITQSARSRVSSAFRSGKRAVLVTSDVSARGTSYLKFSCHLACILHSVPLDLQALTIRT